MSPNLAVILLFIGIVILILVHICVIEWGFRAAADVAARGNPTGEFNNAAMSIKDVEMLPSFEFDGLNKEATEEKKSPPNCAVCLDYFEDGDKCRLLPLCKHSFHTQCVDVWLVKMPSCPVCRSRVSSKRFSDVTGVMTGSSSRDSSWWFSSTSRRSDGLPGRDTAIRDEADGDGSVAIRVEEEQGNGSSKISDRGNPPEMWTVASFVNGETIPPAS